MKETGTRKRRLEVGKELSSGDSLEHTISQGSPRSQGGVHRPMLGNLPEIKAARAAVINGVYAHRHLMQHNRNVYEEVFEHRRKDSLANIENTVHFNTDHEIYVSQSEDSSSTAENPIGAPSADFYGRRAGFKSTGERAHDDSEYLRSELDNLVLLQERQRKGRKKIDPEHIVLSEGSPSISNAMMLQFISKEGPSVKMSSEQLLILCATAVENKNVTLAHHAICELKRNSSLDGEPGERLTAYFLKALLQRASSMLDSSLPLKIADHPKSQEDRKLCIKELTSFVDMTPYYRFGYTAANGALVEAFKGMERVHILDFSTTYCMQWPTLIEALGDRTEGPPHVRFTVSSATVPTFPKLQSSYEELGSRLTAFAELKGIPFEFHILSGPLESLKAEDFDLRDGEALGVNCALRLHYLMDESAGLLQSNSPTFKRFVSGQDYLMPLRVEGSHCPRDNFLQMILDLNPAVVTLYEEDCDTTSTDVVCRLKESYSYEWMPFDFLATFSHHADNNCLDYEKSVGRRIENIIACEGLHRIERLQSKEQWLQRMRRLEFRTMLISDDIVAELKDVLEDHASGWGMKLTDNESLSLTWKGHSLAFASAWVPASADLHPHPS